MNPYGNERQKTVRFRCSESEKALYNKIANKLNCKFSRLARAALFIVDSNMQGKGITLSNLCEKCPNCGINVELSYDIDAHVQLDGSCWNCGEAYLIEPGKIEEDGETIWKKGNT